MDFDHNGPALLLSLPPHVLPEILRLDRIDVEGG